MYEDGTVATRRHLNWATCSFLTGCGWRTSRQKRVLHHSTIELLVKLLVHDAFQTGGIINSVWSEERIEFQFPATNSISVPSDNRRHFSFVLVGCGTIVGCRMDKFFQESPRARCPSTDGGDRCEHQAFQLYKYVQGMVVYEIRELDRHLLVLCCLYQVNWFLVP